MKILLPREIFESLSEKAKKEICSKIDEIERGRHMSQIGIVRNELTGFYEDKREVKLVFVDINKYEYYLENIIELVESQDRQEKNLADKDEELKNLREFKKSFEFIKDQLKDK